MEDPEANRPLEERLRASLQARYPQREATPAQLAALAGKINAHARRQAVMNTTLRSATWISLAALFVITFGWAMRALRPPQPAAETPLLPAEHGTPTPAALPNPLPSTPEPQPTPAPVEAAASALFPLARFRLGVELPAGPQAATVYRQELPLPASAEDMRQTALQMGLDAPLYMQPGEGPDPIYAISDGFRLMRFAPPWADLFIYYENISAALESSGAEMPFEQAEAIARAYLTEKGLLQGDALAQPLLNQPGGVRFTRLLEGRPVIFGVGSSAGLLDLEVIVNARGEVSQVTYAPRRMQPAGEYPILSAEQAWQQFLTGESTGRVRYGINMPAQTSTLKIWRRAYPAGQPVHVYGYVSILQPWDSAGVRLAHLNNWLVAGPNAAAFANAASPYDFWHTWGTFQADEQGRLAYFIEGWEVSPLEEQYLSGIVRLQDGKAWLESDQGVLEILSAPPDLPDGAPANLRAVSSATGKLDWFDLDSGVWADPGFSSTDTIGGGGGGGGGESFGGGAFMRVSLQTGGATPTPSPAVMPSPYQDGGRVEGAPGTLFAIQHIFADGRSEMLFNFSGEPLESFPEYWTARLESAEVGALQALQGLPVRLWGQVQGAAEDGTPRIMVERLEEVYPGLRFQAWLGVLELVVVEGRGVQMLNTVDGEDLILRSSIDYGEAAAIGQPGERVIVEGLAIPGETFGGYPVINEWASSTAGDLEDLSSYEILSSQPSIWDETYSDAALAGELEGDGVVEQIELVYAAATFSAHGGGGEMLVQSDPELAPWLYVQPVWRFRGSFEDGRSFEIQVQALGGEYLR